MGTGRSPEITGSPLTASPIAATETSTPSLVETVIVGSPFVYCNREWGEGRAVVRRGEVRGGAGRGGEGEGEGREEERERKRERERVGKRSRMAASKKKWTWRRHSASESSTRVQTGHMRNRDQEVWHVDGRPTTKQLSSFYGATENISTISSHARGALSLRRRNSNCPRDDR